MIVGMRLIRLARVADRCVLVDARSTVDPRVRYCETKGEGAMLLVV